MSTPRTILLVDCQPYQHRDKVLRTGEYEVTSVESLREASQLWKPGRFDLVLIATDMLDGDPIEFCSELKRQDARQTVALLTGPHVYFPGGSCPDEVIDKDNGPQHLLHRVGTLLDAAAPYFAD